MLLLETQFYIQLVLNRAYLAVSPKMEATQMEIFNFLLLTLMLVYHCHKPVFTPKIAIFRRAGMREGGLPLPLTFQYLIFMI